MALHDGGTTWKQVFHTVNQTDFATRGPGRHVRRPHGVRPRRHGRPTRAFLGDASDDFALDGDDARRAAGVAQRRRRRDRRRADGDFDNTGWIELSNETTAPRLRGLRLVPERPVRLRLVRRQPAGRADEIVYGGTMNYDELPAYGAAAAVERPRGHPLDERELDPGDTTWHDMTAVLERRRRVGAHRGLHPDEQAIGFSADGTLRSSAPTAAWRASTSARRRTTRRRAQPPLRRTTTPGPLNADGADGLRDAQRDPGRHHPDQRRPRDLQFQSLSFNPKGPDHELLGGTQDNGTWSLQRLSRPGSSGRRRRRPVRLRRRRPAVRYHNYFNATPEVNFNGDDPTNLAEHLRRPGNSGEAQSFYSPFAADPVTGGRAYTGLEHVWRTDDNGGDPEQLAEDCNALHLDPDRDRAATGSRSARASSAASAATRAGQYVVATWSARRATGHAVGGDPNRPRVRLQERRRARPRTSCGGASTTTRTRRSGS